MHLQAFRQTETEGLIDLWSSSAPLCILSWVFLDSTEPRMSGVTSRFFIWAVIGTPGLDAVQTDWENALRLHRSHSSQFSLLTFPTNFRAVYAAADVLLSISAFDPAGEPKLLWLWTHYGELINNCVSLWVCWNVTTSLACRAAGAPCHIPQNKEQS